MLSQSVVRLIFEFLGSRAERRFIGSRFELDAHHR